MRKLLLASERVVRFVEVLDDGVLDLAVRAKTATWRTQIITAFSILLEEEEWLLL